MKVDEKKNNCGGVLISFNSSMIRSIQLLDNLSMSQNLERDRKGMSNQR